MVSTADVLDRMSMHLDALAAVRDYSEVGDKTS
jgi:hypothetical protein